MQVEVDPKDVAAINALRIKAFHSNSPTDKDAYLAALSKWFQNLVM